MKRILALIFSSLLLLSLCACNELPSYGATGPHYTPNTNSNINSNVGNGASSHMPPKDEYDEIVLQDDRYILCMRDDTGFTSNVKCYGIFDTQLGKWAMDYTPLIDVSEKQEHKGRPSGLNTVNLLKVLPSCLSIFFPVVI